MTDATPTSEAGYQPPKADPQSDSPKASKSWRTIPPWWIVLMLCFFAISVGVSFLDQAGSRLVFIATTLLGLLILCIRNFWRPVTPILLRVLPAFLLVGLVGGLVAARRVDEMDGNLLPTRTSWRWEPKPDERLESLAPVAREGEQGIDISATTSDDFPQFFGPNRDGFVDVQLAADWDSNPPQQLWLKTEFGAGHSGFVAANGFAFTLEQRGTDESVTCYEIESGNLVWCHTEKTRHETVPGGVGPRSTPAVHQGNVYTMGATGILLCLDGATGDVVWRKELLEEINTTPEAEFNVIQWGRAASPLIDEGRVIIPLGLSGNQDNEIGATLAAFNATSGDEIWRNGSKQISYASPQVLTLGGVRQLVQVCESEVCGFDINSGEQLWEYPWPGNSAANASCSQTIAVDADRLFVSKAYAHGAALLKISQQEGAWSAEKVWQKRVMKTKFTNAVLHNGYIYGLDDSILSCVELETGKKMWKRGRYGHGQILKAGTQLLVQVETGDVALVELNPNKFVELTRFTAIEGRTWNNPCLYGKTLLVRNGQQAACYRLP